MTDRDRREIDVLDWIDWGLFMVEIEEHRSDPKVMWQDDLSWDQIRVMNGIDHRHWPGLEPGDVMGTELGTTQLYWPAVGPLD